MSAGCCSHPSGDGERSGEVFAMGRGIRGRIDTQNVTQNCQSGPRHARQVVDRIVRHFASGSGPEDHRYKNSLQHNQQLFFRGSGECVVWGVGLRI
jgi:hypothetical protein